MKKFVSIAAIVAAGVATPALAQSGGNIEPYVGVLVGYDSVKAKVPGDSESQDGFVYGGVIGAQTDIGSSALIGIEGEVTGATTSETQRDLLFIGDEARLKAGRDFFIGARLGFRPSPGLLAYAKGGYTNARFNLRYDDGITVYDDGENLSGYRIGAGIELGEGQIRFRGEYRFSDYGDYKINGVNTGINMQRHQIMVGAVYGF
jgi:outer membrane immunogenic protein